MPQGSAVYDIIAEMILGYADLLLSEELKKEGLEGYEIHATATTTAYSATTMMCWKNIIQTATCAGTAQLQNEQPKDKKISDNIITDSIKAGQAVLPVQHAYLQQKGGRLTVPETPALHTDVRPQISQPGTVESDAERLGQTDG